VVQIHSPRPFFSHRIMRVGALGLRSTQPLARRKPRERGSSYDPRIDLVTEANVAFRSGDFEKNRSSASRAAQSAESEGAARWHWRAS